MSALWAEPRSGPNLAGSCLARYGIHSSLVHQPAARFWPFQFMEAGIHAVLSVLLLTLAVVWIRRRMS
jgi:hypothetical protein